MGVRLHERECASKTGCWSRLQGLRLFLTLLALSRACRWMRRTGLVREERQGEGCVHVPLDAELTGHNEAA